MEQPRELQILHINLYLRMQPSELGLGLNMKKTYPWELRRLEHVDLFDSLNRLNIELLQGSL
jgi:hypothetical protein